MRNSLLYKMAKTAVCAFFVLAASAGWAIEAGDLARLKEGGVSDETLALLVREKSLETAAITVEEILSLKRAGIGEDALQAIISEGSFMKDAEPRVTGERIRAVRFVTVDDIVALKEAGVKDDVIRAVVEAASGGDEERRRKKALDLLREMNLILDMRQSP